MSRPQPTIANSLLGHMPPGWAIPRSQTSNVFLLLLAAARLLADVEQSAENMGLEMAPGTSNLLLTDYERVLGPDPCGRDGADQPVSARQLVAQQRWSAGGGQSEAFYIALAASLGVTITIDTDICCACGETQCGDELVINPENFVWRVNLPATKEFEPILGDLQDGDYLGWFTTSLAECAIRRAAPAHTIVVTAYS